MAFRYIIVSLDDFEPTFTNDLALALKYADDSVVVDSLTGHELESDGAREKIAEAEAIEDDEEDEPDDESDDEESDKA
jgi:hypothetical protein